MKIVLFANNNGYKQFLDAGFGEYLELVVGPYNKEEKYKELKKICTHKLVKHKKNTEIEFDFFIEEIKKIKPDLILSVCYSCYIPKEIFTLCPNSINIHGAILPKFQGCGTNIWNFLNFEKVSGVTSHFINEKFDEGDIIYINTFNIEDKDTIIEYIEKQKKATILNIKKIINIFIKKEEIIPIKQNKNESIYWKPYKDNDLIINNKMPKNNIVALLKAFYLSKRTLKLLKDDEYKYINTELALKNIDKFLKKEVYK